MTKFKTIVKDGKKYRLVPVEDGVGGSQGVSKPTKDIKLEDSQPKASKGVRKAVGKVSTYREKFKSRTLSIADLPKTKFTIVKIPEDKSLDKFEYDGEKLFFGKGVEQLG